jgi:hypothetical protein
MKKEGKNHKEKGKEPERKIWIENYVKNKQINIREIEKWREGKKYKKTGRKKENIREKQRG